MAAAQNGDAGAYASLLTSLLPVLRGFVRRRGVDASAVEDVVQEVLLLIHRARHTWRADRPFDPWLWAIARNATTDALRRQLRERARRERARDQALAEPSQAPADPEAQLAARGLTPVRGALARLPPRSARAVGSCTLADLGGEGARAIGAEGAHRGSRTCRRRSRRATLVSDEPDEALVARLAGGLRARAVPAYRQALLVGAAWAATAAFARRFGLHPADDRARRGLDFVWGSR
jgi:RNA polymerase sigma-70 factor (ECF subfamily)